MRTTLLIDLDGVLRRWPTEYKALEAQSLLPEGAIMRAAFERNRLDRVVTGKISDAAWRREIAQELSQRYPGSSALAAIEKWSESTGEINSEVLDLTKKVRPRCQVVLITNGTDRLHDDLYKLGLSSSFDSIVNSSEVGFAKPSPEIFRHALALAGAEPQSTHFVDDSRSHVEGARILGINSHHYQTPTELADFLAQHGLWSDAA